MRATVPCAAALVVLLLVPVVAAAGGPGPLPPLSQWRNISLVNIHEYPAPRAYAVTAFDAYDGVAVVVGGLLADGQPSNQSWIQDDGGWENATVFFVGHAPFLSHAAMALDVADDLDVMVGGLGPGNAPSNLTYVEQNFNWTNATPTAGFPPPAGDSGVIATDPGTGGAVWVPGAGVAGAGHTVWLFLHRHWSTVAAPGGPSVDLAGAAFFEDPRSDTAVLYTINASGGPPTTWQYRSGNWTLEATGGLPSMLAPAMTYDATIGDVLLAGPVGGSTDLYAFANGTWENLTTIAGPGPSARLGAVLLFDPSVDQVVFYGGAPANGPDGAPPLGDTWQWGVLVPPPNPTVTVSPVPPLDWLLAAVLLAAPPLAVLATRRGPGPPAVP
ncbi:MAG: hypothetical protein L3K16_02785 [Thermoplasmata archaeon]|nr:hypothetical protein [Thermoplasmata archaeon]